MKVEIVERIPFSILAERIRGVPLLRSDPPVYPYEKSMISLRESYTPETNLLTLYLIRENVEVQRRLREAMFRAYGIDTLDLQEGFVIETEGKQWGLIPPIIELTPRKVQYVPGDLELACDKDVILQVPVLLDGAHRAWIAREEHRPFKAVYISGATEKHPLYAYPNDWGKVKVIDQAPADKKDKKFYSSSDPYSLYRDFGVLGCGAPRDPGVKVNG